MLWRAVEFEVAKMEKAAICCCLPLNAVVLVLGMGMAAFAVVAPLVVLLQKAVLHQVHLAFVVALAVVVVSLGALWCRTAKPFLKAARGDEAVWYVVCRMRFV